MPKVIDLVGVKFTLLTVIKQAPKSSGGRTRWECLCECGNSSLATSHELRRGDTKSCGCLKRAEDKTGKKFGRWTVIGRADSPSVKAKWICRCECGETGEVFGFNLTSGSSVSCGCFQKENAASLKLVHGMHGSPEYTAWANMIQRCTEESNPGWENYGGRGITVCEEWMGPEGFVKFIAYIGKRPSDDHQLDRYPDNNAGYAPGNVRWATKKQNCRNTRRNRIIAFAGLSLTISEWSEKTGLRGQCITRRMDVMKWSAEKALTTPSKKNPESLISLQT